jgi:Protein of unknown function (DUF3225)
MSGPEDSRRAFLAGGTVVAASAAFVSDASAQSKMVINDPSVVREIEAEFAGYDRALASNDVAALNGFFLRQSLHDPLRQRRKSLRPFGDSSISKQRCGLGRGTKAGAYRDHDLRQRFRDRIHALPASAGFEGRTNDANLGPLSSRLANCRRARQHH